MKKIYPSILIIIIFGLLMVVQVVIHGQKVTANKIENSVEKYSVFENEFTKLNVKTTKGTKLDLDKIDSPVVILNFWASWCTPCVKEFASLNKLIDRFPNKIKVIGINNDDENPLKKVRKIEKKYALKFESMIDKEGKVASVFNVTKIPASIVYFKGKIMHFSNETFDFMDPKFLTRIENKLKI